MKKEKYIAFLRGINVGGHHKVPMADLRKAMGKLSFENVVTLLNSGNIIFEASAKDLKILEKNIAEELEKTFGFSIPTIIRKAEMMEQLLANNPFEKITITKEIRLYVSFLQTVTEAHLTLPWKSEDGSFEILDTINNDTILSVLDLSKSKTPKAMKILEQHYGKDITTRNWNTILRIGKKLKE